MEIKAIKNLANRRGSYKSLEQSYIKDLKKEFFLLVNKELSKFFQEKLIAGDKTENSKESIATLVGCVKSKSLIGTTINRIKTLKWLRFSKGAQFNKNAIAVFTLNPTSLKKQLDSIKDKNKAKIAIKGLYYAKVGICFIVKEKSSNVQKSGTLQPKKSKIINVNSFTVKDLKIRKKAKYSLNILLKDIHAGMKNYLTAVPLLNGILALAQSLSEKSIILKTTLTPIQLKIIEKNFLPVAAAVSAMSANPQTSVMFIDNGFVLFKRNEPIGRFGPPVKKSLMKDLIKQCKEECISIPGSMQSIMDVLDAEGKPSDKRLKEIFNDFSKHMYTNSSGPAARAAAKIKHVARISGSRMDWTVFKKTFDEVAKRVKEIEYDPMVEEMKSVAIDLNRGRNVISPATMNWTKTFEKKNLNWLGTLAADILEEEVNVSSLARRSLSCVANWKENVVDCKLSIYHFGSEGEKASLSPCKKFYTGRWKIELQNITKGSAGWKKSR